MKNAYLMKSNKQVFKIKNQVIIWWIPTYTQEKFVPRCRGLFKIVAIYRNSTYKLVNKCETLKTSINEDLLRIYCWHFQL